MIDSNIYCMESTTWQRRRSTTSKERWSGTNLIHTLGFYARNEPGLFRSFKKSAATLLSLPMFAVTDQYSRKVFNDLYFKRYKGVKEDRLRYLADDLFISVLKPAVFPGAYELLEKSRSLGLRRVVVTGALDVSVGASSAPVLPQPEAGFLKQFISAGAANEQRSKSSAGQPIFPSLL